MENLFEVGLLAQAAGEGNPIGGLIVLGILAFIGFAIFGGKKDKYQVTQVRGTSVRKVK